MRLPLMGSAGASDSAFLFCLDLVIFFLFNSESPYDPIMFTCPHGLPGSRYTTVPALWRGAVSRHQALGAVSVVMASGDLTCSDPDFRGPWGWGINPASHTYLPQAPGRAFFHLCNSLRKNLSLDWGPCGQLLGQGKIAVLGASNRSQICLPRMGP